MPRKLSIVGDLFMLSDMFERAILERCRLFEIDIRKHDLQWPDFYIYFVHIVSVFWRIRNNSGSMHHKINVIFKGFF